MRKKKKIEKKEGREGNPSGESRNVSRSRRAWKGTFKKGMLKVGRRVGLDEKSKGLERKENAESGKAMQSGGEG